MISRGYVVEYFSTIKNHPDIAQLSQTEVLSFNDETCSFYSNPGIQPVLHEVSLEEGDETPIEVTFQRSPSRYQFRIDDNFSFEEPRLKPTDAAKDFIDFLLSLYAKGKRCEVTRYKRASYDAVTVKTEGKTYYGTAHTSTFGSLYKITPIFLKKKYNETLLKK